MEAQPQSSDTFSSKPQGKPNPSRSNLKITLLTLLAIILIAGASAATYLWQHHQLTAANQTIKSLSTASKSATQVKSTPSASGTFTYKPGLGGLSLTLPKTYEVLVAADGNFGGAPGVLFKVVPVSNTGIADDSNLRDEAEVQIGGFSSLSQSVSAEESQMQQDGDCSTINGACDTTNFSVSDTTIGGQPAKLIIARGADEYVGNVNAYVGGLDQWGYSVVSHSVTTSGTNNNLPDVLLKTVLQGINLKKANWP